MSQMIEFARPDGKSCPAYLSLPEKLDGALGVVVIQEWWGLNEQIKSVADRLAQAGYRALVPDLFRGKLTQEAGEANHMMDNLDFMDAALQDIRGAAMHLKSYAPTQVAVMGFCMGGALTVISAAKVEECDLGVCFYGIPPVEAADPADIKVPFVGHFATRDDWCTQELVLALEERLKTGGVNYELFSYEADHAFMNQARPEVYDAASAQVALGPKPRVY